jgi:hypothetical protein
MRAVAIFAVLAVVTILALSLVVPRLAAWTSSHCVQSQGFICHASAAFLNYWWLALLPTLIVAATIINWRFFGDTAA